MSEAPFGVIAVREGVRILALRTPTLPPATHTNAVVIGHEVLWVVDPATPHNDERERLLDFLDDEERDGRPVRGIVLTHHHRDHVGAAAWLKASRGWPILAHPRTQALLEDIVHIDETIDEGRVLSGSEREDDQWHVLHTPGHASGHIVLWEPQRAGMIGGDMVAAIGTIIVEPPDGHMATYIGQLRRLAALEPRWLVPAHGEAIEAPVAHSEHYIRHRLGREARVRAALSEGAAPLSEVTARSYRDVPAALHPLAERSCLAHLIKLEEEELAYKQGEWWSAKP